MAYQSPYSDWYKSSSSSGSSGTSPWANFYGGEDSEPKKKKKKDDGWSWGGLLGGIKDTVFGLDDMAGVIANDTLMNLTGIATLGKKQWDPGANTGYQTDDVAKAIAADYKYKYAPALPFTEGTLGTTWKRMGEDELGSALDVLTVLTLGAGGAAKVGAKAVQTAGTASKVGKAGAKISNLKKVGHVTEAGEIEMAADAALHASRAARAAEAAEAGDVAGYLASFEKSRVGKDGEILAQGRRALIDPDTKQVTGSVQTHSNPIIRGRQSAKEALYASRFGKDSYFGPATRGPRMTEKAETASAMREYRALENRAVSAIGNEPGVLRRAVKGAVGSARNRRRTVFYVAQGFNTPERVDALIAKRRAQLESPEVLNPKETRAGAIRQSKDTLSKARIKQELKDLAQVRKELEKGLDKRTQAAVDAVTSASDANQAMFRSAMLRRGKTIEEADEIILSRRSAPLRSIGVEPLPDERIATITHSPRPRGSKGGQPTPSDRGLNESSMAEMKHSTGESWEKVMYDADPLRVLDTNKLLTRNEIINGRLTRALQSGEAYDPALHDELLRDGKAYLLHEDSDLVHQMDEVHKFMDEELGASMDGLLPEEITAIEGAARAALAQLEPGSKGVVIPMKSYEVLKSEYRGAQGLVSRLTKAAVKEWRSIVLSLRGTFYVNNFLGNLMLGLIAYGPAYLPAVARESIMRNKGKKVGVKRKGLRTVEGEDPRTGSKVTLLAEVNPAHGRTSTRVLPGGERRVFVAGEKGDFKPNDLEMDKTPEGISSKEWYHGTGTEGLSAASMGAHATASNNLFGPGIYLTDDPSIAATYAKSKGRRANTGDGVVYSAAVNVNKVLDMDAPPSPDFVELLAEEAKLMARDYERWGHIGYEGMVDDVFEEAAREGATNASLYDVYKGFFRGVPMHEIDDQLHIFNAEIRSKLGYDAMTHQGGERAGRGEKLHQVVVVLDPEGDFVPDGTPSQFNDVSPKDRPAADVEETVVKDPDITVTDPVIEEDAQLSLSNAIDEVAPDLARTSASASTEGLSRAQRLKLFRPSFVGDKVARQGAKLTENNFRRAAFRIELRKEAKRLQRNMKDLGQPISYHEAVTKLINSKAAVERMTEKVYGNLLDYSKLTPFERDYILPLMPFWNFTRSITGRTVQLTLDEPWKANVLKVWGDNAGQASQVNKEFEDSNVPDYVKSLVSIGGFKDDKAKVASLFGANPFASIGDTVSQIQGLFGETPPGETVSPLSGLGPIPKVILEATSGQDLFYKKPIPGGLFERAGESFSNQIPFWSAMDKYRHPSKRPNIERTGQQIALRELFGYNVGTLNADNVRENQAMSERLKAYEDARQASYEEELAKRSRDINYLPGL